MDAVNKLLMIHGYNHDPDDPEHDPGRPGGNFPTWEGIFTESECIRVPWYSAIQFRDTFRALSNGHSTTYRYAYLDLVPKAVQSVLAIVDGLDEPADIVAHSLGTRVALQAVLARPVKFRRVLMLNGAEIERVAKPIIKANTGVQFLNIAVYEDDVLNYMGDRFAPGEGKKRCIGNGMPAGVRRLSNFDEIVLDDEDDYEFFLDRYGWNLAGDGPSAGDHSYSFLHDGNYELFRRFFRGDL